MRLEKPCGLSLVEHTARSLRQAIQSGHLKPGSRLVESAIADEMGISRGPVREAIQQLAGEGLLEIHPRRGAVVRGLDAKTAYEVQTLRGVLEGFAARLCADRLSEQRADALRRQLQTLMSAAEAGDVAAFVEADVAFHGSIVDFADHHRLSLAFHALNPLHGVACNFGLSPGRRSSPAVTGSADCWPHC
ncbi:hypothetical protein GCM10025857_24810 [Alicyclobacillus contaminans]|nr:hypothetical protein GCM10025857_24810 [Alicyclobacillus contaminans]